MPPNEARNKSARSTATGAADPRSTLGSRGGPPSFRLAGRGICHTPAARRARSWVVDRRLSLRERPDGRLAGGGDDANARAVDGRVLPCLSLSSLQTASKGYASDELQTVATRSDPCSARKMFRLLVPHGVFGGHQDSLAVSAARQHTSLGPSCTGQPLCFCRASGELAEIQIPITVASKRRLCPIGSAAF